MAFDDGASRLPSDDAMPLGSEESISLGYAC